MSRFLIDQAAFLSGAVLAPTLLSSERGEGSSPLRELY